MARIFVSYNRKDQAFTRQFVAWLKEHFPDHTIWYDTRLLAGDSWWNTIQGEIDAADVFIYLVSNHSLRSPWCQKEFALAAQLKKPILPILIQRQVNFALGGEIQQAIQKIQYVTLRRGVEDASGTLLTYRSLNALLAGQVKPQRAPTGSFNINDVNAGYANVGGVTNISGDVNIQTTPDRELVWYRDPAILVQIMGFTIAAFVILFVGVLTVSPERFPFTVQFQQTQTVVAGLNTIVPTTDAQLVTNTPLGVPTNIR